MKAKELKRLRKELAKVNKRDYDALNGISIESLSIGPKDSNDEALSIQLSTSADITNQQFDQIFALYETNMSELYKNSSWGWDPEAKLAELKHNNARYLLVQTQSSKLAGFMHFRFDYNDEDQPTELVVYVYEIQIDQCYQRRGIGKALMEISEHIALHAEFNKVMLTVFKSNESAIEFYRHLNYSIDPTSPSNYNDPADYEILSKTLQKT